MKDRFDLLLLLCFPFPIIPNLKRQGGSRPCLEERVLYNSQFFSEDLRNIKMPITPNPARRMKTIILFGTREPLVTVAIKHPLLEPKRSVRCVPWVEEVNTVLLLIMP